MGLRGPGAKPVAAKEKPVAPSAPDLFTPLVKAKAKEKKEPWQKRGLSRAGRVIAFIETLKITSGAHAGKPFKVRTWQRDIIEAVYRTGLDQRRVVRTALLTMPRKQGKSALAAALALAHLVGPEAEQRGQVYSAAADRNQAALIFNEMKAMILADVNLSLRVAIKDFAKVMEDAVTGSVYQALSSDAKTKHGFSASCIIYDELAQAPDRELYDVLTTSTAARAEPLTIVISTQSSDPNHIMSELVDYGHQVNDGLIDDPTFHATIYAAPEDADIWDEAVWRACNPALGDFRSLEEMRAYATQARRIPAREAVFRNLYLNQAVDADPRFLADPDWRACGRPFDLAALRGRPCWGGLDLSSTTDLTALSLYFPEDGGALALWYWIPGADLDDREDRDRVPYRLWRDQKHLQTTPGRTVDKRAVAFHLAEIASQFDVQGVAYDRWGIEDLKRIFEDEGIRVPLKPWGQGFKDMGPAVDAFETAILNGRIRHGNHPVLSWNVANAAIETDPTGARKLSKRRSIARIDGLVASVMAVGLHSRDPKPIAPEIHIFSF